jgi:hypothetical protein
MLYGTAIRRLRPLIAAVFVAALALPASSGAPNRTPVAEASPAASAEASAQVSGAFVSTTTTQIPLSTTQFVPCANAGLGEVVTLSGTLHRQASTVLTGQTVLFSSHANYQGVSGTGLATGTSYRAVDGIRSTFTLALGSESTVVETVRMVSQRAGDNFLLQVIVKLTITPNGTLTALASDFSFRCR